MIEEAPKLEQSNRFAEIREFFYDYVKTLEIKRINPLEFKGHPDFSDEEIDSDLEETKRLKKIFEREFSSSSPEEKLQKENGKITEAIFTHGIVNGDLLGPDTNVVLPSEYDDFIRKIDLLVEAGEKTTIDETGGPKKNVFGLAFDFSSKAEDACKKLSNTLKNSILRGFSPSVKYGKLPGSSKIRNMRVAKVIIGADAKSVADFADELANNIQTRHDISIEQIAKDTVYGHPVKTLVIDEILSQLVAFRNIAYAFNNPKAGAMYHRAYAMFNNILSRQDVKTTDFANIRRGDKLATALHGMIGFAADPTRKYRPEDFLGRINK